ncbi:MAG: 16S rRNA (guanine(527)-N(7))-methyltransferase RsmG [Advenella sp.]|nr:16S rRNA (guanine(527)-N(7))-methyltransferase RsmG [Advenella sp.]
MSEEQASTLLQYIEQMQRWNKTYNLTAVKKKEEMLVQHIFDSLSVVMPLRNKLADRPIVNVLDVGSGGGLPGVVLAIMCSTWNICCIDAVEKKTAFIRQMSGVLTLPNLSAQHIRIEQRAEPQVDLVISRAFASLADFASLAGKHVHASGYLAAMKGHYIQDEVNELVSRTEWEEASHEILAVPELDANRCLIWLQRKG